MGRRSYSVDLDSFENLVQTRPLGLCEQAHVSNLLSLHDSSNNWCAYGRCGNQIRQHRYASFDARMPTLPTVSCELATEWQTFDVCII